MAQPTEINGRCWLERSFKAEGINLLPLTFSNKSFSLDELEGKQNGRPFYNSSLANRRIAARAKKIDELTTGEIRLLIGQQMGLEHLLPIALEILEQNPLAHDHFDGELLITVLEAPLDFWQDYPELNTRLVELKQRVLEIEKTLKDEILPLLSRVSF